MMDGARRRLSRLTRSFARRALHLSCMLLADAAAADAITDARYEGPTNRYPHAVLGDDIEYETLILTQASGKVSRFTLSPTSVFEDTEPRVVDLDNDGLPEVIAVESSQHAGARLVVYGTEGQITATPYIGTRFRWLAPVGAADLDEDGKTEIAYVDRPHLAKTLRIWRYEDGRLSEVATYPGVTNHRIGEVDIAGGIRLCDGAPELVLASANWSRLLVLRFTGGDVRERQLGADTSRAAFARALDCLSD